MHPVYGQTLCLLSRRCPAKASFVASASCVASTILMFIQIELIITKKKVSQSSLGVSARRLQRWYLFRSGIVSLLHCSNFLSCDTHLGGNGLQHANRQVASVTKYSLLNHRLDLSLPAGYAVEIQHRPCNYSTGFALAIGSRTVSGSMKSDEYG